MIQYNNLAQAIGMAKLDLRIRGQEVKTKKWQGIEDDSRAHFWELLHYSFQVPIPRTVHLLQQLVKPNVPWADTAFLERVGRVPSNPGEAYKIWPFYPKDDSKIRQEKFTHTYQERMWPKYAGSPTDWSSDKHPSEYSKPNKGIRYEYGDLNDLLKLLGYDPYTRQAFLPIWFPEDTGVVHGGRVPCTLGYHFILRNGAFDITYYIRACDAIRHFQDDVYLACRLLLWVLSCCSDINPDAFRHVNTGSLIMHIISFHVFYKERNLL